MIRKDQDPPLAVSEKGMRFHHVGIPTDKSRPNEKYLKKLKMYVSGFETSEYGIEWMRFEDDSPIHSLIQKIPHIAFEVDNIESAIQGKEVISDIDSPAKGIKVAMIIENGVPVEFLEFDRKNI